MTTTFGTLGRWMLLGGAAGLLLGLLTWIVVPGGTGRTVTALVLAGVGAIFVLQGAMWTVLQLRMFGSPATLRRVATTVPPVPATIVSVRSTSSAIGAQPIARLGFRVGTGPVLERRILVPFNHAAEVRPGAVLPVRFDPAGSRATIVEWDLPR